MIVNNPFALNEKIILVTGASSGIGKAIAIECSKMGAKLIITARNEERLKETLHSLSGDGHQYIIADLSINDGIDNLVKSLPIIDGIVHAAGLIKRLPLKFINEKNLGDLMQINFFAPALTTQKIYKAKKIINEGSIVFISSVATNFASFGNIMYMASKGAINSISRGIAFELATQGIRVNCIEPGMVVTNLTKAISDDELAEDVKRYPLGRFGKPEEIGYAAIFLLSSASKWITGSVIKVDGGLTLR
jgi:NAD(P)-dependent dehydrogenase (short-subunit alcohol dehydrogenase family)